MWTLSRTSLLLVAKREGRAMSFEPFDGKSSLDTT